MFSISLEGSSYRESTVPLWNAVLDHHSAVYYNLPLAVNLLPKQAIAKVTTNDYN